MAQNRRPTIYHYYRLLDRRLRYRHLHVDQSDPRPLRPIDVDGSDSASPVVQLLPEEVQELKPQ